MPKNLSISQEQKIHAGMILTHIGEFAKHADNLQKNSLNPLRLFYFDVSKQESAAKLAQHCKSILNLIGQENFVCPEGLNLKKLTDSIEKFNKQIKFYNYAMAPANFIKQTLHKNEDFFATLMGSSIIAGGIAALAVVNPVISLSLMLAPLGLTSSLNMIQKIW